jgi:hypothetical protein
MRLKIKRWRAGRDTGRPAGVPEKVFSKSLFPVGKVNKNHSRQLRPLSRFQQPGAHYSVTHHAQHHEKFRANFGLYFNVWDRLMGTNHRDYEHRLAQAAAGPSYPLAAAVYKTISAALFR